MGAPEQQLTNLPFNAILEADPIYWYTYILVFNGLASHFSNREPFPPPPNRGWLLKENRKEKELSYSPNSISLPYLLLN